MARVRVDGFTISVDGYAAGPDQSLQSPLGRGGERLHQWLVETRTFKRGVMGQEGGKTGPDDEIAERAMANLGAWVMGRHMFAPSRGPWPDDGWRGWWGEEPVYHSPVFVLTHHARAPLEMKGGTTFHFVTGGIEEALYRAKDAAGERDVRIGGGASTIRQYLEARLIDDVHVAISPVLLGGGEPLFQGLDLPALGYDVTERVPTENALHVRFAKRR
jgi:dihydrofolate reductase